ncbi:MAG TPA: peptide chain release factor N(5)-glutamine methyltransferase [Ktedonobacteraceae bacterium]|nr:peptide chain release factor N(5)-glutamine methyltransferase [Ktedonobacteraceae bacterium]
MMTISTALAQGTYLLTKANLQTGDHEGRPYGDDRVARLETQVLLSHVLHVDRSFLFAYPEHLLSPEQELQFLVLIERRKNGEPTAYLIGHQEFYGLEFLVDQRVLIPRPETELLVEVALQACRTMLASGRIPIVADIGTGSGAIPITLAIEEPRLPYLYASDISSDALAVASLNCQRHDVADRVRLLQGDLLAPLPEPVDVVTANLPYVGTDEVDIVEPGVRDYEPHLALFSGPNGLDLLWRFLVEVQQTNKLKSGAILVLEIGYQQREPLASMLQELLPGARAVFKKDYGGWDRVLHVAL